MVERTNAKSFLVGESSTREGGIDYMYTWKKKPRISLSLGEALDKDKYECKVSHTGHETGTTRQVYDLHKPLDYGSINRQRTEHNSSNGSRLWHCLVIRWLGITSDRQTIETEYEKRARKPQHVAMAKAEVLKFIYLSASPTHHTHPDETAFYYRRASWDPSRSAA